MAAAAPFPATAQPPLTQPATAELRRDARPADAARSTIGLWSLVLLIYLPMIVRVHQGQGVASVALDCSTILVSMLLAAPLFLFFRQTLARGLAYRIATLGLMVLAAAMFQAGFDLLFTAWIADNLVSGWQSMPRDLARGYNSMINYASVFAVNVALFQLAYNRRSGVRQERRLATMQAATQRAELDALRFKLNPHFLFNTLNGISAMIVTRRLDEADEMVDRLSAFLRASLTGDSSAPVTIEQELAVIDHYARIEELRFGDRLDIEIGCAGDACDRRLPPLLVQGLVEQAIEAASRADVPARVGVTATVEAGRLCVTITHPHMDMPERHLATARARVAGLAGAQVVREDGATRLCLPVDESEAA